MGKEVSARPETASTKAGYIKVRLTFQTYEPTHIRSVMLESEYGIEPPYTENLCILLPRQKAFSLLEAYLPAFQRLQDAGLVSSTAQLTAFHILDEDNLTLAYICD